MSIADAVLVVAVVAVTAWLGRRATPRAQVALWISALVVSAAMFLPMSLLRGAVPDGVLAWLEARAGVLPLTLADAVHFVAFVWLAVAMWMLRPDLRGGRIVAALVVLAVASELMQGLTVEREARLGDVAINLLGAGLGLAMAVVASARWHARRPPTR